MLAPWKESYDKARQHIKKQRHLFAHKDLYSQSYGFSSSHVQMWELDHKEGWMLKNWCTWIVVLEKTLESPLDCNKIKPVNPKGNQPWIFTGRTYAEAEAPITLAIWYKDPDAGKDGRQKEKGVAEDEMIRQQHQLSRHELEQTSGDSEGQGSLACSSPWDCKELTQLTNWTTATTCIYITDSFCCTVEANTIL